MVTTGLLLGTIIVIIADVLIGVFRGSGFSLLRIALWSLGTVIAALISKSVTVRIITEIALDYGFKAGTPGEMAVERLAEQMDEYYAELLGASAAGMVVSLAVPVVFVALFIIAKIITWILYLILKLVIKHLAKKKFGNYKKLKKTGGQMLRMSVFPEQGMANEPVPYNRPPAEAGVPAATEPAVMAEAGIPAATEPAVMAEAGIPAATEPAVMAETGIPAATVPAVMAETSPPTATVPTGFLGFFVNKPAWSRIVGGVLGFLTAVFALAIIASPATGIMNAVADRDVIESALHLIDIMESTDFDTLKENALSADEVSFVRTDGKIELDFDTINSSELLEDWDSLDSSPVTVLYTFTGAKAVAEGLYRSLSTVTADDLGLRKSSMEAYSFADTAGYIMGVIPRIDGLATALCEGNGLSDEVFTAADNLMYYIFGRSEQGGLLSQKDKKNIVNRLITEVNDYVRDTFGVGDDTELIPLFNSYEEIVEGMDDVLDMVGRLLRFVKKNDINTDIFFASDMSDYEDIISEPGNVNEVIDMLIDIDGASQLTAGTANAIIDEITDGLISNLIKPEGIERLKGDAAVQLRVAETVSELAGYAFSDPDTLTAAEEGIIYDDLMYLADLDILNESEAYDLWYHYAHEE